MRFLYVCKLVLPLILVFGALGCSSEQRGLTREDEIELTKTASDAQAVNGRWEDLPEADRTFFLSQSGGDILSAKKRVKLIASHKARS